MRFKSFKDLVIPAACENCIDKLECVKGKYPPATQRTIIIKGNIAHAIAFANARDLTVTNLNRIRGEAVVATVEETPLTESKLLKWYSSGNMKPPYPNGELLFYGKAYASNKARP